jgi:hypothetical protein
VRGALGPFPSIPITGISLQGRTCESLARRSAQLPRSPRGFTASMLSRGHFAGVCSFAKGRDSRNYRPFQEECFVEPTLVGSQQSTLALPLLKPQVLHFPRGPVHRTQEHQPRRWTSRASRTPRLPDLSPSTSLGVFYRPGGFKPYTQLATVHTLWLFYSLNNLDLWLPEFSPLAHAR